ncbi:MAG: aminotransferase class I/II-fold pyridoxal phosphate-dependent enzyme [Pirellulales bacterium]|nr:aminotransferase class I/II-fold pyridoxal phosphate-dependent enzyme [Pirellulales bacterium]
MQGERPEATPRSDRRTFLKATGVAAAGMTLTGMSARAGSATSGKVEALALDGGPRAIKIRSSEAWKWPLYGQAEEDAMKGVLQSPDYTPLDKLEDDWRKHFGIKHCRAHCNGTSALTSGYFALDLPPGSEVLVPSYTFFATIAPMRLFGLVPVFVDINPQTLNLDLEDAKRRLTKNTKAIVPVHWIGLPCDMDDICDWADEKGLIVLEDACHAHGVKLKDRYMGSWGRIGVFSFQATKPLPAIEGGMGVYRNKDDHDLATAFGHYLKCYGDYEKYKGSGLAVKMRMHPMAAELARCQLRGLEPRNAAIVKQTQSLNDRLLELPGLLKQTNGRKDMQRLHYAWNMLFIDEKKAGMSRDVAVKALQAEGVNTSTLAYPLQHEMPLYHEAKWWHHKPVIPDLPNSTKANQWALPLPCFTSDQPELCDQYVKAFEKVWAHRDKLGKG